MAHHDEHSAPLRKPHVDLWKLNRGPKLSNAEFFKLVQNPFCTWNHLKVMYPWVLSFTLVGYTMFNAFRPKNIDVKHFENSLYRKQLEDRGVYTKENNVYNPDKKRRYDAIVAKLQKEIDELK